MDTLLKTNIDSWRRDFKNWSARCERDGYTDTEVVWLFLNQADGFLKQFTEQCTLAHDHNSAMSEPCEFLD